VGEWDTMGADGCSGIDPCCALIAAGHYEREKQAGESAGNCESNDPASGKIFSALEISVFPERAWFSI
jgi:hypothetical protein